MTSNGPRRARIVSDKEHFSGRRHGVRRVCVMPVECGGASGSFAARSVDLSRRGALIEIRDPRFPPGDGTLLDYARAVAREFPRAFTLSFADVPMAIDAHVARVTRHASAGSHLMGCEFLHPLTERQCRALGLPTEDSSERPPAKR